MLFLFLVRGGATPANAFSYKRFLSEIAADNVSTFEVSGDEISGSLLTSGVVNGTSIRSFRVRLPENESVRAVVVAELVRSTAGKRTDFTFEDHGSLLTNILTPLIPWLLIFSFVWFSMFRVLRSRTQAGRTPIPVYLVHPDPAAAPPPPVSPEVRP